MKWHKGVVSWTVGKVLYLSIPFSWLLPEAEKIAKSHKGQVKVGGPAVIMNRSKIDWAEIQEMCDYDVLAMHNPLATFTTRGCIRKCPFCAVSKLEGDFKELKNWKPNPVICDNNFLASSMSHFNRVIDTLRRFPYVDFNQGLDARIFKPYHAFNFAKLQGVKVRFALDHINNLSAISDAISLARKEGLRDFGVYVLIGFNDTPEDALERLEFIRSLNIWPNPMRYQPLDCEQKNSFIGDNWTEEELKKMTRYYSRLRWLEHIPYQEYNRHDFLNDDAEDDLKQKSLFFN